MREVTIKELSRGLSKELNNLPFKIMKYGKSYAVVQRYIPGVEEDTHESTDIQESTHESTDFPSGISCRVPGCTKLAVGYGKVWDGERGEYREVYMCGDHLREAKGE